MSVLGAIIALIGFAYALFIIIAKIFGKVPVEGWAPIMVLILVLSGIQMLMLGIIGEYLWRTLDQVRKRPHFLIESVVE
jgi:dolichol-phosphate mannosyltransferase